MQIDVRPVADLSPEDQRELNELELRCCTQGVPAPEHHAPRLVPAPADDTKYVIRVWEGGMLVSCLWITERTILIDGRPAYVAGIRGVRTDPEYRRRGFAGAAMRRAADFIWKELRPELALLLSSEMAVPFYRSLGWQIVTGPVFCQQPGGIVNVTEALPNNPAMVLLPAGGQVPRGSIDLCGLPW
jgi:GNAT superfamily N-acetyltransferase